MRADVVVAGTVYIVGLFFHCTCFLLSFCFSRSFSIPFVAQSRSLWPYSMCDKYMCCVLMHTSAGVNNTRTVFVFFLFISAVCICNAFGPFTIDFVAILIQVKRSDLGYGGVRRCFLGRVIIFVRSERTVFLSTVYFQWLFRFSYILMRTHPNTSDAHTFRSCIQFIRLHASISFSWNTDHRNQ